VHGEAVAVLGLDGTSFGHAEHLDLESLGGLLDLAGKHDRHDEAQAGQPGEGEHGDH
jgi:hypothetical protein